MQIKKLILFSVIIILSIFTTSCYDSTEVDDMIYVLAIGIDDNKDNLTEYTFQTAIPLNISSGVETGFSESEETVNIQNISIISDNLFSAIELANTRLTKELNLSHCKLILFSEHSNANTLKQNISNINNYNEFRPDTLIAMCEGSAIDYLKNISSPFEKNPARFYEMFFKKNFTLKMFNTEINEFEKKSLVKIPHLKENAESGAVIIKDYQNIAFLSPEEAFALNLLSGKNCKGYVNIPQAKTTVKINNAKSPKVHVDISKNPKFTIKINLYGSCFTKTNDETNLTELTEQHITDICQNLLYKSSKDLNTDVAELIKFSKPKFITTKEYTEYNWSEKYPLSDFDVKIKFNIIK